MNINKIKLLLLTLFILLSASSFSIEKSYSYTSTLQEMERSSSNQLLRVSLEPCADNKTVNVNLYTSNGSPTVKEKDYGDSSYIIELDNTVIATSNNISTDNVSSLIKNVKVVPYLNTSNPLMPGMARVIINAKQQGVNYKVNLKQINTPKVASNSVKAKVYYPKKAKNEEAQNLAFFSPLDEKTLSDIPEEELLFGNRYLAQATPQSTPRLQLSPPTNSQNEIKLPGLEEVVNPSGPVGVSTIPPTEVPAPGTPPANPQATTPGQEGQAPQPAPSASQQPPQLPQENAAKPLIPPNILSMLTIVCPVIVFLVLLIAGIGILKLIKSKKKSPSKQSSEAIGLKDIKESAQMDDLEDPYSSRQSMQAFNEEIEEIEVIDNASINGNKNIYLVQFCGKLSLIGSVNDNIFVLNTFHPDEFARIPQNQLHIIASKEGSALGKEIYLVKIANWQGVVIAEANQLSLHTDLTVE